MRQSKLLLIGLVVTGAPQSLPQRLGRFQFATLAICGLCARAAFGSQLPDEAFNFNKLLLEITSPKSGELGVDVLRLGCSAAPLAGINVELDSLPSLAKIKQILLNFRLVA